jgi:hypothetical protein
MPSKATYFHGFPTFPKAKLGGKISRRIIRMLAVNNVYFRSHFYFCSSLSVKREKRKSVSSESTEGPFIRYSDTQRSPWTIAGADHQVARLTTAQDTLFQPVASMLLDLWSFACELGEVSFYCYNSF